MTMLFDQKTPTLSDSKVCPYFIRDLQLCLAGQMQECLLHSASIIDAYVSSAEQRCAKMMTILKPIYSIAGIEVPPVPAARLLSSYPMAETENKTRLRDDNMDAIRLTVFRARRKETLLFINIRFHLLNLWQESDVVLMRCCRNKDDVKSMTNKRVYPKMKSACMAGMYT